MKIRQQFLLILIFALFLLGNAGHFMLPQVYTSTKTRAFSSDTKANLHNVYLACKSYWSDQGPDQSCNREIASATTYGYIQSQEVKIHGSGTENDFCAFAWHLGNREIFTMNTLGTISSQTEAFSKNTFNTNQPDKIWIYENFLPRHLVYYSIVWVLPIATMFLTFWGKGNQVLILRGICWALIALISLTFIVLTAGGFRILPLIFIILTLLAGSILIMRGKRKYFNLWAGVIAFCWAFVVLVTSEFAQFGIVLIRSALNDFNYYVNFRDYYVFLYIPVIYSISRAFSLIRWGKQIETGKKLSVYLKNQNAKKLKKSGAYLFGVIGILLAVNFTYIFMYPNYRVNYWNQSVKLSEEIEKIYQADPSSIQNMCKYH